MSVRRGRLAAAVIGRLGDGLRLAVIRSAATAGAAVAQNDLGWAYLTGRGVRQDDRLAYQWMFRAARQGDPKAQVNIGRMTADGRGVAGSYRRAMYWYRRAAEQGHPLGQFNLGFLQFCVLSGYLSESLIGGPTDPAEAFQWLYLAAPGLAGEARAMAQRHLGRLGPRMTADQRQRAERLIASFTPRPELVGRDSAAPAGARRYRPSAG
jgi:TPR repeat protein